MYVITYTHCSLGCAIGQAVTSQLVTAKTRVWSHVSPCEILGAQGRKGKGFSPVICYFGFLLSGSSHQRSIPFFIYMFPLSGSSHQCSMPFFIYMLLLRKGQMP